MNSFISILLDTRFLSFLDLLDFEFNLIHIIIFFILLIVIFYLYQKINTIKSEKEFETLEEVIVERNIELKTKEFDFHRNAEELKDKDEKIEFYKNELGFYKHVLDKLDNSVIITDSEGNIEWVNEGFSELYGIDIKLFTAEKGKNLIKKAFFEDFETLFSESLSKLKVVSHSRLKAENNGDETQIKTLFIPINAEKSSMRVAIVESDTKDVDIISDELKMLSLVASNTDNAVIIMNSSGVVQWVNDGFKRLYDLDKKELDKYIGKSIYDHLNTENKEVFNDCLKRKKSDIYHSNTRTKTGKVRDIQTLINPIVNGNDEIDLIIAVESDVTRIKEVEREIIMEKERSESLLLNILPNETAEELKLKGMATPRFYSKVSVLFTDFQGFSRISEDMSPSDLVNELHSYFVKFDEIVERYYMEKIKTIGDAYMCAGGLPIRNRSHPFDAVMTGLEIQRFIIDVNKIKEKYNMPLWKLRIGIHTGAVVAGVVGKKKFAYDIWGATVNIASRVEAACEEGKVNISGATHKYVKDFFDLEYRGEIEARNIGKIEMYFVHGIKKEYSVGGEGIVPNERFKHYLSEL
jgi:PAS domain S-box-containing protein